MRFITYEHSRTGVRVELPRETVPSGFWKPVVEVVVPEVVDEVVVEEVPKVLKNSEKKSKPEDVTGLEWLNDDFLDEEDVLEYDFSSYKELMKKGFRIEGATATVLSNGNIVVYKFDGNNWRKNE